MATKPNDSIVLKKLLQGIQTQGPASRSTADAIVPDANKTWFHQDIKALRAQNKTLTAIRTLARVNGDVSAAVAAMVRLANTELRFEVYSKDHLLDAVGSDLLMSILQRMTNAFDYTQGFDHRMSLAGVKEALLRSIPLTGACGLELVLDKQRLPFQFLPLSVESLKFQTTTANLGSTFKVVPMQQSNDGPVILDFPTVFYASLDQDLETVYPASPMEPALNSALYHAEVVQDIQRVTKRSGHSRLMVKLVLEQVLKAAPVDIKNDPAKLTAWVESQRQEIVTQIENLTPESALVFYDSIETEYLNSEIGASADYSSFLETVDTLLATSMKTPASLIGKRHSGGSQNTSSTESLLFIKTAEGLHAPVETILSRCLTLALRLYGYDGYVEAKFDAIDLRPTQELEAYKNMTQARILELLSIGFLDDAEAAQILGVAPIPAGTPPRSGTMFYKPDASAVATPTDNNSDPTRRAITGDTPKAAGGTDNKPK
jgi:hypothetical protein